MSDHETTEAIRHQLDLLEILVRSVEQRLGRPITADELEIAARQFRDGLAERPA